MNHYNERPKWLHLPDYDGYGIVNLMSSLAQACAAGDTGYKPVPGDGLANLSSARNIILLVIDGLGYDYLINQGQGSLLGSYCHERLTSVCPSTTASAIPTFLTGLAPQQHGFTGWFTYFSELGSVLAVLPFHNRIGATPIPKWLLSPAALCGANPLLERMQMRTNLIAPERIANSNFNRALSGQARISPFKDLNGLRKAVRRAVQRGHKQERSFSYAYWPEFDSLAHRFGVGSLQLQAHFSELDHFFAKLLSDLRGSDSILLVTADHGFIDTSPDTTIRLEEHPQLQQMLMVPLCGEPRMAFCYPHWDRQHAFEAYMRELFSKEAMLFPSQQLLQEGWFGLGVPDPRLQNRIGQYTLVMKDNWTISDRLPGEKPSRQIGVHGGVSEQEMYVPLIYAEC